MSPRQPDALITHDGWMAHYVAALLAGNFLANVLVCLFSDTHTHRSMGKRNESNIKDHQKGKQIDRATVCFSVGLSLTLPHFTK